MAINFEVTQLPPPVLEFGGPGEFLDQKAGLAAAGPFDLRFGGAHRVQVRLGLVGPAQMVEMALHWLQRCQRPIVSQMANQTQYPMYPGFQEVFKADLLQDNRWVVEFDENKHELEQALALKPKERFEQVLNLYAQGVNKLAGLHNKPDVVICCIPENVIRACWSISNDLTPEQWKAIKKQQPLEPEERQLSLFSDWEPEETSEDLLYRDFRRALKARAMQARLPIQLGREKLFRDLDTNQDAAARAWNMSVAVYYKAGGIPWRIKTNGPETCFVGISFFQLKTNKRYLMRSSIAQAFSTEGDGFALKGDNIPWDPKQGRDVHLSAIQATSLAMKVLSEYRERSGGEPLRIVLHKSSKFNEAETEGFKNAFRNVPIVEMINLTPSMFRLVQFGSYPPKRGTLCRVNNDSSYIFTSGYIPEWKTYPGPHIPAPIRIVTDNKFEVERAAADILSLTKMNWNTAQDTSSQPVTLRFARMVGGIMAEVGDSEPELSYRYYM